MRAVDGVSLTIGRGEIVGLAGESGCGKSTMANAIMQLLRPPARLAGGRIVFDGQDLVGLNEEQLRRFRWRNVSMVFQSAMNALNPVMRVGDQFVDMMHAHERISKKHALDEAGRLLEVVGIDRRRLRSYPHQLSGGMRQRVIIAMALALRPELVIMDEPTTALDVVVQREILQQIRDLQAEYGFAVVFITHDLSLLLELAHRVEIMYAGEIVESAPAAELRTAPKHPYTIGLIESFPPLLGKLERLTGIPGSPPDLSAPPSGCRFHPRCPHCVPGERAAVCPADDRAARAARGLAGPPGRLPPRRGGGAMTSGVLEVRGLTKRFPVGGAFRRSSLYAVDDVSFTLSPGRITALAGESGSGKSTVARLLARLYEPTAGSVIFDGRDIAGEQGKRQTLAYRSQVQMIFQDPFGSLNPVKTVRHHLERPLRIHGIAHAETSSSACWRCSRRSGSCRPSTSPTSTRTRSPAASDSASRSRARWRSSRAS